MDAHPRPGLAQGIDDTKDAGERGFLHPAAVGGTQDRDAQARKGSQQGGGARDRIGGHRGVGGSCCGYDGRLRVAGQVQARVDGDAVAADRDAGPVDVGVGLGIAGLNDTRDVDANSVRVACELVGQADIDVPVGGFGELSHLGGLGAAHGPHAVGARQVVALIEGEDGLVEGDAARLAGFAQAPDELRVARQVGEHAPGEDALGREHDVEVAALDQAGHADVAILAYSAKYASAYFGPFREAVGSTLKGDRRTYQQDPANRREGLFEALLDAAEGADMLMVKPAGPYLDVLADVAAASDIPVAAYQVSGEYAMVEAAAANGWIDRTRVIDESLTGIFRAGADSVLTYWALEVARRVR